MTAVHSFVKFNKGADERCFVKSDMPGPGKYVLGLRINTQIDTPTDSKQVLKSIDWYRLVLKGIDEGLIRNRCHFVHVKVGVFRKGLAFLNIP